MKKVLSSTGTEKKDIQELLNGFDDRYQKLAEEIKRKIRPDSRILDVGCGEAKIWQLFPGLNVTGLDLSLINLKKAQKYLRPIKGQAEKLPFKKGVFDLVVASEILEHLLEPEKAINEIDRVLKPKGAAIITFPNTGGLQLRLSLLFWGRNPTLNYPQNISHLRFFNLADFKKMLQPTKLKIEKVRGSSFLAFHKINFGVYLPLPRKIRTLGGDLFPSFSLGNLVVLKKK